MAPSGPNPIRIAPRGDARWTGYMTAIQNRQAEALAQLYDETSRVLYGLASRILSDPADAEEVLLDTYQHVWNAAGSFDASRGSVLAWLATMTRNRAIDRLRQGSTRRSRELPFDADRDWASDHPAPEAEMRFGQERALIRRAMSALAPEQREAIELAFFRGMTHVEVAETLNAPLGTIKSRIRTGIQKLREALPAGVF
jgi:RNA polymerase sigma-70 factor (ECF subfamily)